MSRVRRTNQAPTVMAGLDPAIYRGTDHASISAIAFTNP
jgi:hypothetical protein